MRQFQIALLATVASAALGFRVSPEHFAGTLLADDTKKSSEVANTLCHYGENGIGQYKCLFDEPMEELQRAGMIMQYKKTVLAETYACYLKTCDCTNAIAQLQPAFENGTARAFVGSTAIDCDGALAEFEAQIKAYHRECRVCPFSQKYELLKAQAGRDFADRRAKILKALETTKIKKVVNPESKHLTSQKADAAAKKCATEYLNRNDLGQWQLKEALKTCVAAECRPSVTPDGKVADRFESKVDIERCARDGFARAWSDWLPKLKGEKQSMHDKLMAMYANPKVTTQK